MNPKYLVAYEHSRQMLVYCQNNSKQESRMLVGMVSATSYCGTQCYLVVNVINYKQSQCWESYSTNGLNELKTTTKKHLQKIIAVDTYGSLFTLLGFSVAEGLIVGWTRAYTENLREN